MAIYLFLFVFCIIISRIGDRSFNHRTKVICITIIIFAMSIVGGVRDIGVGTDTEIYTEYYFQLSRYISSISDIIKEGIECDRGYLVLNWISHLLGDKPQSALFLSQLFTLGLIFSATYKISNHIGAKEITSFTILFCFMYYNMTYNYMRQFCALSLLIWGLYYIVKNKWWHYVVIQMLAYFFHTSSVFVVFDCFSSSSSAVTCRTSRSPSYMSTAPSSQASTLRMVFGHPWSGVFSQCTIGNCLTHSSTMQRSMPSFLLSLFSTCFTTFLYSGCDLNTMPGFSGSPTPTVWFFLQSTHDVAAPIVQFTSFSDHNTWVLFSILISLLCAFTVTSFTLYSPAGSIISVASTVCEVNMPFK